MSKFATAQDAADVAEFVAIANMFANELTAVADQIKSTGEPYEAAKVKFTDSADIAAINARLDALAKSDGTGSINDSIKTWSPALQQTVKDFFTGRLVFPDAS